MIQEFAKWVGGIVIAVGSILGLHMVVDSPIPTVPVVHVQESKESDRLDIWRYTNTKRKVEAEVLAITNGNLGGTVNSEYSDLANAISKEMQTENLGATNALPTSVALFETSLATSITSTATTMTLTSATDKAGTALASSTYAFILDEGTASEEMVIGDCTGTDCRNLVRGVSVLTGTTTVSSLRFAHRRGASVKITDGPQLLILSNVINGIQSVPNTLFYANEPSGAQWSAATGTTLVTLNKLTATAFGSSPVGVTAGGTGQSSFPGNIILGTNSAGTLVVATGTPQLDVGFIHATSTGYTATSTFAGDVKLTEGIFQVATTTATSTFSGPFAANATTSIACGTNTKSIWNGVGYVCPSSQGSANTFLGNDGSGNLSWGSPSAGRYTYGDATGLSMAGEAGSGFATSTGLGIPASTMTASSTIQVSASMTCQETGANGGSCTAFLRDSTGANLGSCLITATNSDTRVGSFTINSYNSNSVSSQKTFCTGTEGTDGGTELAVFAGTGTSAINTSAAVTFHLVLQGNSANATLAPFIMTVTE